MENRTNREKSILIEDIMKRLPYGLFCHIDGYEGVFILHGLVCKDLVWRADLWSHTDCNCCVNISIDKITPYLKPIESMTENEKILFCRKQDNTVYNQTKNGLEYAKEWVNWCYENHYDIDNSIDKGLALDGTKLNSPSFDSIYEDEFYSEESLNNLKQDDDIFIEQYYKDLCYIRDYKEGNSLLK